MNIRKRIRMRRLAARKAAEAVVVTEAPVVEEAPLVEEAPVAVKAPAKTKFAKKSKYRKTKTQVVKSVVEEAAKIEGDASEE